MALFRFLVAVTTLLGFVHQLVFAFPTVSPNSLVARDVPCDDISMYTTQFFLDNAKNKPGTNGLFYTGPWMKQAITLARTKNSKLKTVWDVWDCKYYNKNINDLKNPLRCIFSDTKMTSTFFENQSRAMAMLCDVTALLMTDSPGNIDLGGVWGRVEFPALKLTGNIGGQVNTISAIDPQGNSETEIWDRYDDFVTGLNDPTRRDVNVDYCYTADQLTDWFGGIDW